MSVAGMPNARYLVESVKVELEGISRKAGYWTDVARVIVPGYPPGHVRMLEADAPSLHLWAMQIGLGDSLMGEIRRVLGLWIGGVLKTDQDLQENLIEFAECVRAVMLLNPARNFPTYAGANTWGVTTIEDADGTSFATQVRDGVLGEGWFLSKWRIEYVYAPPVG